MAATPSAMRLAAVLGIVAALLAWTAVAVRYVRHATIDWSTVAAGLFIAAVAFGAWAKSRPGSGQTP
jgi:TRAP-type C4-dicarboxylate transport system permease small subunit